MGGGGTDEDELRRKIAAQQQNVIIPEMGAGKYWYVDPRASGTPGSTGSMPVEHTNLEQQALYKAAPDRYSAPHEDQMQGFSDAVQRLFSQDFTPQQAFQAQSDAKREQDRRSVYSTISIPIDGQETEIPLWYKGMTPSQAEDAARMRFEHDLSAFATDEQLQSAQKKWQILQRLGITQDKNPSF